MRFPQNVSRKLSKLIRNSVTKFAIKFRIAHEIRVVQLKKKKHI